MEFPDHCRQNMGVLEVKIVIGPVQVCRHNRDKVRAVLFIVVSAELDRCDLRYSIRLIRRLERSGQKAFLFHRLGSELRIYAGRAEVEKFCRVKLVCSMDHIRCDHDIVVDEISLIRAVGQNTADSGCSKKNIFWPFLFKKSLNISLTGKIKPGKRDS